MSHVNEFCCNMQQKMLQVLQDVWGYTAFREPQDSVILNALSGKDGLVVMATGGGKSLCYQVPPLVSGQPCVVISPLISLMEDQVAALNARGVPAAFLGSAQTSTEVKRKVWQGEYQLIYITPELASNQTTQLQQLHAQKRIGLIAVDEAHCVSEWGHDFRPDYRQLGCLRQALPGVPILAVTATATQRVRQDILNNLGMGKAGSPQLKQWIMSFQRTNLHLSVQMKAGTAAANNMSALVAEAREAQARGVRLDSTLIYAQTVREVDEIAAHLQAKGVSAVKYHAKMPVSERMSAHRSFQRDDAAVMVATVAFGMGIDKPNIRRIIHFGIPSSLESYYQQVGRAGRDGLPSSCCLMWGPQDFTTMDLIRSSQGLSGWNLESHSRGMSALRTYTSSGACRHALLVNFFQPGTLRPDGPCEGGCDNCKRRAAAASGHTQSADGLPAGKTDVTECARLLIATVKALKNCYGTARAVSVLRGSKAKNVERWMMELQDHQGNPLHGAGNSRSDDWWKGLAGVLMGEGYLQTQHKSNASGASWSVLQVTAKGQQFLANASAQLQVMLPLHMEAEETKKQRQEAAERQRAAAQNAAQQQQGEVEAEKEELLAALKETRKQIADTLNQAPDTLVNDATLNQLKELRPTTDDQLMLVGGFGAKALMHFAVPLLQVVKDFCSRSQHLKPTTDWHVVQRSRNAVQQSGLQQGNNHFTQQQIGAEGSLFSEFAVGPQNETPQAQQVPEHVQLVRSCQPGAPGSALGATLLTDMQVYQSFLDSKVLGEPRGAANAAWDRYQAGETAEQIANQRDKPIQISTAIGYLAEAAAAAGAAGGCPQQLLQRLQQDAGLVGSSAAEQLLWKVLPVVGGERTALTTIKKALPDDVTYGQIKVVAALLSLQALPQLDLDQCPLEAPTMQVERSPALDKLLSLPGISAQQLYRRWRAGVPLAVVGSLDGKSMQLQAVLSALAEMAAAGYPVDLQQLADAAQLQEAAALDIAAAINKFGQIGIQAVKEQLDPHVGYGQVKVVAALMAVKGLWFSPRAVAIRELEGLADLEFEGGALHQQQQASCEQTASGTPVLDDNAVGSQPPSESQGGACRVTGTAPATSALAAISNLPHRSKEQQMESVADQAPAYDAAGDNTATSASAGIVMDRPTAQKRAGFALGNKSGKRRRPTAIAPPPVAAAAPSTVVEPEAIAVQSAVTAAMTPAGGLGASTPATRQQRNEPNSMLVSPAPVSAAKAASQPMVTPADAVLVSQETVLKLLWSGGCTAAQIKDRLGVSGVAQELQLQRVLEALVEAGDQVCTTPADSKVDVHDNCVRFIAF